MYYFYYVLVSVSSSENMNRLGKTRKKLFKHEYITLQNLSMSLRITDIFIYSF